MVIVLEHSLRPRGCLHATTTDNWPSSSNSIKYKLVIPCNESKYEDHVKALRLAKERPDIDELQIQIQTLIDPKLRKEWSELLDIDRSWTVHLDGCKIPEGVTGDHVRNGLVRDSLAVLRKVKRLTLSKQWDDINDSLWFLRSLPVFEQLEWTDCRGATVDQHSLEYLMDLPVAPKLAGIQFSDSIQFFEQPIFSKQVTKRLHSFLIDLPGVSVEMTLNLIDALSALPTLHKLDVCSFYYEEVDHKQLFSAFFEWLSRPNCTITELTFDFSNSDFELEKVLFPHLSQVPKLQTLSLTDMELVPEIENFLQFLRDSRAIEFVYLNRCKLNKRPRHQLLELQLQCRPRLITVQWWDSIYEIEDRKENELEIAADEERFDQIALLFRHLRAYRKSLVSNPIPQSAWPVFLEKLGKTARYTESLAIQEAGIDAIYGVLPDMLHCMNWSPVKKRKRTG